LFAVAYDWGRWIQMAVFPLSLLSVAGILTGAITYQRFFAPIASVLFIGTWSISHAHGEINFHALFIWPALLGLLILAKLRMVLPWAKH